MRLLLPGRLHDGPFFSQKFPAETETTLFQPTMNPNMNPQAAFSAIAGQMTSPKFFNDERDGVIGQFNRIQALYGHGKVLYSNNGVNVQTFDTSQHPELVKFKAIAYSEFKRDEADDRVSVVVKYTDEANIKPSILQYENNLKSIFNGLPAKVEPIKTLPGNRVLLAISVNDPSNPNHRMPCHQLLNHLNSPMIKGQLNNIFQQNFSHIIPLSATSKREVDEYLANPPMGIDSLTWNQAKNNNPDPSRFIPVPLIGFKALNERFKLQEQEIAQQNQRVKLITDAIFNLEKSVEASKAKLDECRKRNLPLKSKVLRLMVYQEVMKKRGLPIQPEEDALRARLEKMNLELNAPTKFKGCLNELISRVKQMQSQYPTGASTSGVSNATAAAAGGTGTGVVSLAPGSSDVDFSLIAELKSHLKKESEAIAHLLAILKQDQTAICKRRTPDSTHHATTVSSATALPVSSSSSSSAPSSSSSTVARSFVLSSRKDSPLPLTTRAHIR